MASEPFWKELVPQDEIEAQWDAIQDHSDGEDFGKDAFALARFAEARMYERARVVVERLEAQLAEARGALSVAQDAVTYYERLLMIDPPGPSQPEHITQEALAAVGWDVATERGGDWEAGILFSEGWWPVKIWLRDSNLVVLIDGRRVYGVRTMSDLSTLCRLLTGRPLQEVSDSE